jgi:hypothetical protein
MRQESTTIDLPPSAGALEILRESIDQLSDLLPLFGLFGAVALTQLVSPQLGNLIVIFAQAFGVVWVYNRIGPGEKASNSLGVRLLIAFIASIVAGIGVAIGTIFLVIPGLYLMVRFRLVVASVMIEDSGPIEAIKRSWALTEAHAWTIFGVMAVTFVASALLIVGVIVGGGGLSAESRETLRTLLQIGTAVSTLAVSPIGPVSSAIMYGLYSDDDVGEEIAPDSASLSSFGDEN